MAVIMLAVAGNVYAVDHEEGGYVYHYTSSSESRFVDNVYNFLKHFSYDQYYWCEYFVFTSNNNYYVDNMDFSYYSGHGSNWYITMGPGASYSPNYVDLTSAGSTSHQGWGDRDLEFVTFQSCSVIPSPLDVTNWYSNWTNEPGGIFDGLHQAVGYRTSSYSGNGISNNFGSRIQSCEGVWQAWFNAVNDERSAHGGGFYPGYASAVMYPPCDGDSYCSFTSDPPATHTWLKIWYQY